jgi:GGDEF domain-containing protein
MKLHNAPAARRVKATWSRGTEARNLPSSCPRPTGWAHWPKPCGVCDSIRSNPIQGLPATQRVTVSVGVATLNPETMESPDAILKAADKACYQAKQRGKDRVVVADDEES